MPDLKEVGQIVFDAVPMLPDCTGGCSLREGENELLTILLQIKDYLNKELHLGCIPCNVADSYAIAQSTSKVSPITAPRRASICSAPGLDHRIPGPLRRDLNCLMPLSTVPDPIG